MKNDSNIMRIFTTQQVQYDWGNILKTTVKRSNFISKGKKLLLGHNSSKKIIKNKSFLALQLSSGLSLQHPSPAVLAPQLEDHLVL